MSTSAPRAGQKWPTSRRRWNNLQRSSVSRTHTAAFQDRLRALPCSTSPRRHLKGGGDSFAPSDLDRVHLGHVSRSFGMVEKSAPITCSLATIVAAEVVAGAEHGPAGLDVRAGASGWLTRPSA